MNGWLGCGMPMTTHPPFTSPQWHVCVLGGGRGVVNLKSHVFYYYYEFATKHRKLLPLWIYLFPNLYHDTTNPTSAWESQILRRYPITDMPQEAIVRLRLVVFILFGVGTQHIYLRVKMWPHVPTYFWVATIVYLIWWISNYLDMLFNYSTQHKDC